MKTKQIINLARSSSAFAHGVRSGMTSPATIYMSGVYVYPNRTDLDAMHSDVVSVGRDMKAAAGKVIGKNIGIKRVA